MINGFLLLLSLPLFFYKLAQSSLGSWDEAWYAEISKNILKTGDFFTLMWNGAPFSDKPPGGFWLEALSFRVFGISEFSARFPSAIAGFLCLYVVYLLGAKLFNKLTGFLSAVALVSSYWFLYRSRFGDLDTLLTLSYLLTFYLAVLTSKNKKFFYAFCLSMAFLPMVKGIVFLVCLIPSLIIIFWGNKTLKIKDYLLPALSSVGLFGVWILIQYLQSPTLAFYHFHHSLRNSSLQSNVLSNFSIFKEYLHSGIGKWFWPGILGAGLGLILRDKKILPLVLFFLLYSVQFLFSEKIEIWHLIPLYPFMILLFFGSIYLIGEKYKKTRVFLNIALIIFTLYVSSLQIKRMWFEFIDIPTFISDEAILSKESQKFPDQNLYIDDPFGPVAIFYSDKIVIQLQAGDMEGFIQNKKSILAITKQERLDSAKIPKDRYEVIKKDRDKILIKTF